MPGHLPPRSLLLVLLLGVFAAVAPRAAAQVQDVVIQIDREFIGLAGHVRPGEWTPLRLSAQNRSAESRAVVCRWILRDFDGDRIHAERRVTLNPQRIQHVWLYAAPPVNTRPNVPWTIQVIDAESQALLASVEAIAPDWLPPNQSVIGLCSTLGLGLDVFTGRETRHEAVNVIAGLTLPTLPDRWHGLDSLQTLIWTREGVAPDDPQVTLEIQQAIREWVARGGHLVIVLPSAGQTWTASPLADLLPVDGSQMRQVDDFDPLLLGMPRAGELFELPALVFDVDADEAGVAVLARDGQDRAYVIAHRYGFGRVTLVGIDLADRRVVRMGLPEGAHPIWSDIFHWQAPVYSERYMEGEVREGRMSLPTSINRRAVQLDSFVPHLIAMRNTTVPAMFAAIIFFAVYWVAAGPVSFGVLARRGQQRHSWLVFVAVVAVASVIAWGGALVMRPRTAAISHFSVVDYDARSQTAHTQSWLSLFVPEFGRAQVDLGPQQTQYLNTISSAGLPGTIDSVSFPDPQLYEMDAANPDDLNIPVRATAKQFRVDYMGPLLEDPRNLTHPWVMPQGKLRIERFWPAGTLSHGLPGELRDVLFVYCPGDGQTPWVWRHGAWGPGELVDLAQPKSPHRLVQRPENYLDERQWEREGYLGQLIGYKTGLRFLDAEFIAENELLQAMEMLSFHSALPPPNFRETDFATPVAMYERTLGRDLDFTHLIAGKRLIMIGYLTDAPLPAPLSVDGEPVPSEGWTMVRWVYDLD